MDAWVFRWPRRCRLHWIICIWPNYIEEFSLCQNLVYISNRGKVQIPKSLAACTSNDRSADVWLFWPDIYDFEWFWTLSLTIFDNGIWFSYGIWSSYCTKLMYNYASCFSMLGQLYTFFSMLHLCMWMLCSNVNIRIRLLCELWDVSMSSIKLFVTLAWLRHSA
jgi:hypothetical protein